MECWVSTLLWHLAQLGWPHCQLYMPATLYLQGNSLALIFLTAWVDPTRNRTQNLSCGAMPQSTVPPQEWFIFLKYILLWLMVPYQYIYDSKNNNQNYYELKKYRLLKKLFENLTILPSYSQYIFSVLLFVVNNKDQYKSNQ
jgi:hypothetical protein